MTSLALRLDVSEIAFFFDKYLNDLIDYSFMSIKVCEIFCF